MVETSSSIGKGRREWISRLPRFSVRGRIKQASDYDAVGLRPELYQASVLESGRTTEAGAVARLMTSAVPPVTAEGEPAHILDVAAGTGILSRALVEQGFAVTATDLSANYLSYLSRQSSEIATVQGDMNQGFPDIPDDTFDGVTMFGSNRYITNPDTFLTGVRRVLRPGGRFIWPVLKREARAWRKNAGKEQPTDPRGLEALIEKYGFVETQNGIIYYSKHGEEGIENADSSLRIVAGRKPLVVEPSHEGTDDPAQPRVLFRATG